MTGTVYLVGAGPGDPGLLTLRGGELLVTCDAVVYDALANPALLDLARVAARDTPVELHDMGKRGGAPRAARQDEINELLISLARGGKRVVRLKGGDPLVFGRGGEEAIALARAGVSFEIVPGVTAGVAAPAYAGIPVTHRSLSTSVTFVTGSENPLKERDDTDWGALARVGGTIVLYMGATSLARITEALCEGGLAPETRAAAIEWGTHPAQRTVVATVATLAQRVEAEGLGAPIITVIGDVVALREEIRWFDRRPLFGKRIVVTRARAQAGALSGALAAQGAEVIEMPATRIEPLDDAALHEAVARIHEYQWAVFTSQNAVHLMWDALRWGGRDARSLAGIRVAAVGPATAAALLEHGIAVDVTPERFVAESLLEALERRDDVRGARVLYAAAEGARDVLPRGLSALGAVVDAVPVYRSAPDADGSAALRARLETGGVDLVTFTSASGVNAFVFAVGPEAARRAPAACIGPATAAAARAAGLDVAIEADPSTIAGLVECVVRHAR